MKMQADYTWSRLDGTVLDGSSNRYGDIGPRDYFLYGSLADDHRHELKMNMTVRAPPGSAWRPLHVLSGMPYNRLFRNDVTGNYENLGAPVGINPGANVNDPADDRELRLPDQHSLNAQLAFNLQPLIGSLLEAYVDVLNVLASRTTTSVTENEGPSWGVVSNRMSPCASGSARATASEQGPSGLVGRPLGEKSYGAMSDPRPARRPRGRESTNPYRGGHRHAQDLAIPVVRQPGRGGRQVLRLRLRQLEDLQDQPLRRGGAGPKGSVMTVAFELEGQELIALNGGRSSSSRRPSRFSVDCKTHRRSTTFCEKLTSGGGAQGPCGWLKDRYGLSGRSSPPSCPRC
jgi:hypothetical protein